MGTQGAAEAAEKGLLPRGTPEPFPGVKSPVPRLLEVRPTFAETKAGQMGGVARAPSRL